MMNSGSLQKMFLATAVLVVLVQCGHGQGKPTECCKKVSNMEITEEVVGYVVQTAQAPCLPAVIFYTKDSFYCAAIRAPWVLKKAAAIKKAAAAAAAARASTTGSPTQSSLLSILTSAASAPSSSPPSSSSPSSTPSSSSTSSPLSSSFSPRLRPARH
ncbi:spore coat protein SP96-like [Phycodurus eques]|uniref:spore coat protein SP96-like n=1 Tax=Phycodurus eques TaxID=693459 RepID=UPI002ACDAA85|nr:spore coat protein SP96-like [Phycodurus eques]